MKRTLTIVLLMMMATAGIARSPFFSFGPKAALNSSKFATTVSELQSSLRPGFDVGLFFRFSIKSLYIQPEVLYSFKSSDLTEMSEQIRNRTQSFDVPVLLGYELVDLSVINLRLFVGPRLSFAAGDNLKEVGEKFGRELKAAPFCLAAQAGVGIDLFYRLTVDFRYDFTFTNAVKGFGGTLKPNALLISAGWKLL
ncbi:MAG: PorT family protein [Prevotellaceae bacterium]|jgi:hypothetical protein|nr:PorT family protein [Prevotellaceae bacterium]